MTGLTHDPDQGGDPRLVLSLGGEHLNVAGETPPVVEFRLTRQVSALGGVGQDIALDGLEGHLADVTHDEHDEFVLVGHGGPIWVNGAPVLRKVLRTGDRIDVGPHTLSFYREEYADHGRPFDGRQGGELSVQEPQPSRVHVSGAQEPTPEELRDVPVGPGPVLGQPQVGSKSS